MKNKLMGWGFALMIGLSGCHKYDDGPGVSFRSRKERVSNDWRVDRAYNGSEDVTNDFDQYEISIHKDGGAVLSASYVFLTIEYTFTTAGTWSFADNEEKIVFNYETDAADRTYRILRLEEDMLWVREEGTDLVLHLVPR